MGIHLVSNSEGKLCHEHRPCIVIRYAQENLMHYLTTHVRCIILLFILWLCCNNPKAIKLINFLFCHSSIVWLLVGVPRKQRQNEYIATTDFLTSQHLIEGVVSIKQIQNGSKENGIPLLTIFTMYYITMSTISLMMIGKKCLGGSWTKLLLNFIKDVKNNECKLALLESLKVSYM